jgi:hypothetical protein
MRDETFESTQATVREIAAKSFTGHVVTELGPNEWRCGKPGTGNYEFSVIARPTVLIIYGDLGEGVFRMWDSDVIGWLRSAVRSPHYLAEKLRTKQEAFYPDDALALAREWAAEDDAQPKWAELLEKAERMHEWAELNAHSWPELVYEVSGDGDSAHTGFNLSSQTLWLIEALKWLVEHLPVEAREAVAA